MSFSFLSSRSNSFSTDEKPVAVLWGCELNDTTRRCVVEADDDLLEHLVYLKTVSLGEGADDQPHVVAVESKNMASGLKPVPVASLRHSVLPMIYLDGFELIPPVAFVLKSGTGPVYLHGEHLILEDDSEFEPSEDEVPAGDEEDEEDETDETDETDEGNPEEDEDAGPDMEAANAEMEAIYSEEVCRCFPRSMRECDLTRITRKKHRNKDDVWFPIHSKYRVEKICQRNSFGWFHMLLVDYITQA